ncbi:hypothetical protein FA13DRAFT_1736552 [Coprinellus micaceus]|uniref:Uncharacterized protein n=1 Tax=Coprinellus micaceus TaxID=71717 RepID=A0A4Y7T1N1_COPMI|nr:hypothetical protein FA13DRAFT_1736552 [Coprinellus micaceus]
MHLTVAPESVQSWVDSLEPQSQTSQGRGTSARATRASSPASQPAQENSGDDWDDWDEIEEESMITSSALSTATRSSSKLQRKRRNGGDGSILQGARNYRIGVLNYHPNTNEDQRRPLEPGRFSL